MALRPRGESRGTFRQRFEPGTGIVDGETQFVLNSFSFLFWGALVMWMCAGFTMLEAGSVRAKNASVVCLKNVGLYAIAGLTFYLVGYNVMFAGVEDTGLLGHGSTLQERALLAGDASNAPGVTAHGHSTMSHWFFQMVFVGSTASIVSGTLAERVKLWPFFLFIVVLTAVIYPVIGAWTWGGGWLGRMGFQDFAGSTVVHSTGGWAALAGALVVGARSGKFRSDGTVKSTPPSNVPAVTLGVFIIWLGFLGFNGGSQSALSGALDAVTMSNVIVNTNFAASAGVLVAVIFSRQVFGRIDLLRVLNGAIGGLVAITAGPAIVDPYWAIAIGGIGGGVTMMGMRLLMFLKIDDEVGAISAHMGAGVWGTLAACIAAGADVVAQIVGIVAIGAFTFGASLLTWKVIDWTIGARISPDVEAMGQDVAELGIEAFPEFVPAMED